MDYDIVFQDIERKIADFERDIDQRLKEMEQNQVVTDARITDNITLLQEEVLKVLTHSLMCKSPSVCFARADYIDEVYFAIFNFGIRHLK